MSLENSPGDLFRAVDLHHQAGGAIMKGNPQGYADLYSRRDDVTLGNPFGPFARGYENVLETLQRAAANFGGGEVTGCERVSEHLSEDLACFVEVERYHAKVGKRDDFTPVSVRVTSVFRREDGTWRLVHRHADPITAPRPAESLIQQ
jgi:ketosteroid isomerase-like protein